MPSDPSGTPEPVARLADVLARAAGGARPTPLELAELLWLARHLAPAGPAAAPAPAPPYDRPPDTPVPAPPPPPRPPVPD
ncbi:hypothetical protein ACTT8P_38160, partial [Streptomyces sp. JW3]